MLNAFYLKYFAIRFGTGISAWVQQIMVIITRNAAMRYYDKQELIFISNVKNVRCFLSYACNVIIINFFFKMK